MVRVQPPWWILWCQSKLTGTRLSSRAAGGAGDEVMQRRRPMIRRHLIVTSELPGHGVDAGGHGTTAFGVDVATDAPHAVTARGDRQRRRGPLAFQQRLGITGTDLVNPVPQQSGEHVRAGIGGPLRQPTVIAHQPGLLIRVQPPHRRGHRGDVLRMRRPRLRRVANRRERRQRRCLIGVGLGGTFRHRPTRRQRLLHRRPRPARLQRHRRRGDPVPVTAQGALDAHHRPHQLPQPRRITQRRISRLEHTLRFSQHSHAPNPTQEV